ncbi:hypothetical protein M408DRAFT_28569 [Serendipita vermifera MAFF 305830]|uniref:Uncharacterized protein n=1 Tax=Serendipita vermifera MAFF 305830 TaxID=933852 RepID=A0A0C2W8C2_SERVB|nr:hypothetical protein M408DRAFT_28569 [Serendipita vermifera MAFF 305830]
MATTTTSTTTYNLAAYRYQQDKPGVVRPHVPKEEWRIYQTNAPMTLRAVLETTRTPSGSYVSVVLKILDSDATRPGGPSTLEEIEFIAFSSPEVAKMSSPLKAVLGGKQIGFRYLHPLNANASSQYHKRFQLTFTNAEDANALATSIRHVCPITESQQSTSGKPVQKAAKAMPKPSVPTFQPPARENTTYSQNVMISSSPITSSQPVPVQADTPMTGDSHAPFLAHSLTPYSAPDRMDLDIQTIDVLLPSHLTPIPSYSQSNHIQRQFTTVKSPVALPPLSQSIPFHAPLPPSTQPHQAPTSEPGSSQIAPSTQSNIYSLSAHELEVLTAKIVHEPGFPEMMEKLSKMFALSGFIRQ